MMTPAVAKFEDCPQLSESGIVFDACIIVNVFPEPVEDVLDGLGVGRTFDSFCDLLDLRQFRIPPGSVKEFCQIGLQVFRALATRDIVQSGAETEGLQRKLAVNIEGFTGLLNHLDVVADSHVPGLV
jgi:hypothetical protein